jgi:hypothetical protein
VIRINKTKQTTGERETGWKEQSGREQRRENGEGQRRKRRESEREWKGTRARERRGGAHTIEPIPLYQ